MNYVYAVLLSTLLALSAPSAPDDTVFSELSHDEARAHAEATGRTLVLYFASEENADCRQMEETSWRSPLVVEWVREHGLVLRIDGAAHPELVKRYAVKRIPVLLRLVPGEVQGEEQGEGRHRRHGFTPPSSLISWLHTPHGRLQSPEDLQRIFDDTLAHPLTRISVKVMMAERSEPDEALEHALWVWTEADALSSTWAIFRRSSFAPFMGKLARRHPPAAVAFDALRDAAWESVRAGTSDEGAWLDWLALRENLDGDGPLIDDIQDLLATQGAAAFPGRARSVAWRECERRRHPAAAGMLASDLPADAREVFVMDEEKMKDGYEKLFGEAGHKYGGPFEEGLLPFVVESQRPEPTRQRAIDRYVLYLMAGRTEDALRVAEALLDTLDDVDSRLALIEATLQADSDWAQASGGADAFSRLLAEGTRPVVQVQEPLHVWWEDALRMAGTYDEQRAVEALGERLEQR